PDLSALSLHDALPIYGARWTGPSLWRLDLRRIPRLSQSLRLRRVVADDLSALHHELHALHLRDVAERIAADGDDVGVLALLEARSEEHTSELQSRGHL